MSNPGSATVLYRYPITYKFTQTSIRILYRSILEENSYYYHQNIVFTY